MQHSHFLRCYYKTGVKNDTQKYAELSKNMIKKPNLKPMKPKMSMLKTILKPISARIKRYKPAQFGFVGKTNPLNPFVDNFQRGRIPMYIGTASGHLPRPQAIHILASDSIFLASFKNDKTNPNDPNLNRSLIWNSRFLNSLPIHRDFILNSAVPAAKTNPISSRPNMRYQYQKHGNGDQKMT